MAARSVKLNEIIEEAQALASEHAVLLGVTAIAITALYSGLDWITLATQDRGGTGLLSSLLGLTVSIFGQYHVTEQMLADRRETGVQPAVRRYGSLFGALFLSGIAIAVGVICFIIPGLYLAGRWLTVSARVVEGNLGGTEALRASWADSEPSQLAFSLTYLISLAPLALLLAIGFGGWEALFDTNDFASIAFVNLATGFTSVLGWTIATAAFRRAVPINPGVGQVFS